MVLTMKERLLLLNILPKQGDITTIRIIHDLQCRLSPSEAEHREMGIRQERTASGETSILWDQAKDEGVEIEIGEVAARIICDALNGLNESRGVTIDHLSLFDMFMGEGDSEEKGLCTAGGERASAAAH
jgi:hypothetical protein